MKVAVKLAAFLLRHTRLSQEDRAELSGAVLKEIGALPTKDIVVIDKDGSLLINGTPVEYEQVQALRESARMALNSSARKLIGEQVAFMAVAMGVHNCDSLDKMLFARGALWHGQQVEKLLQTIAESA